MEENSYRCCISGPSNGDRLMIEAEITDIDPDARYQGTVYSQTVVADIDGVIVDLFDGTVPVADKDLLGERVELQITAQPDGLEGCSATDRGIEKRNEMYDVVGTATELSESQLVVDVGVGTVEIATTSTVAEWIESHDIEPDSLIRISAYRLDLTDVRKLSA